MVFAQACRPDPADVGKADRPVSFDPCQGVHVGLIDNLDRDDVLVGENPAGGGAPTAATAAIIKTLSPSVQSRTFRIVVSIALCSISGVSVRSYSSDLP